MSGLFSLKYVPRRVPPPTLAAADPIVASPNVLAVLGSGRSEVDLLFHDS